MINQIPSWREAKQRNLIKGIDIGLRLACLIVILSLVSYLMGL